MRRLILCVLCLSLTIGAGAAEGGLMPSFDWQTLLTCAWNAELTAQAQTVMPLDETRTEELNALIRHLSLFLRWDPDAE